MGKTGMHHTAIFFHACPRRCSSTQGTSREPNGNGTTQQYTAMHSTLVPMQSAKRGPTGMHGVTQLNRKTTIYSTLVPNDGGSQFSVHGGGINLESYRPVQQGYIRYCSDPNPLRGRGGMEGIYFNRLFPEPFPHNVPVVLFIQRPRFYTQSQFKVLAAQVSTLGNCFLPLSHFFFSFFFDFYFLLGGGAVSYTHLRAHET